MVPGENPTPLYIPWPQPFLSVIWLCFLGYWLSVKWELMTPGCKGIYFESQVPVLSPPWVFLFEWGLNVRDWKKDIKFTELKGVNLGKNKKSQKLLEEKSHYIPLTRPWPLSREGKPKPTKKCTMQWDSPFKKKFIAIIFTKNRALNTFPLGHFWRFRHHAPESKNMTPIQKKIKSIRASKISANFLFDGGFVYTLPIL